MYVACKWPSSNHDAKVHLYICKSFQNGKLPQTQLKLIRGFEAILIYSIRDPTHLLTPYCVKKCVCSQSYAENKHKYPIIWYEELKI